MSEATKKKGGGKFFFFCEVLQKVSYFITQLYIISIQHNSARKRVGDGGGQTIYPHTHFRKGEAWPTHDLPPLSDITVVAALVKV